MKRKASDKRKKAYTSLVGVKWTQESLEKCLTDTFAHFQMKVIQNKKIRTETKYIKLANMIYDFISIYDPVRRYGVTVKKKK
jgi:hypothetical protein